MPTAPGSQIPQLRLHRPTGQAVVRLVNPRGGRRDYYCGRFGSETAQQKYQAIVGRWISGGRELPAVDVPVAGDRPTTIEQLVAKFAEHAKVYYRRPDGSPTGEHLSIERACGLLTEQFGGLHPAEFSPLRLRTLGEKLLKCEFGHKHDAHGNRIEGTGKRLGRAYVNGLLARVKRLFRWAESLELVPAGTYHRLATVPQFQAGRCDARETAGLAPVSEADFRATLPHLGRVVRAIVETLWHTGARCGEIVQICSRQVDMSGELWKFVPLVHKNSHRGHPRVIYLGAAAKAVLAPFVQLDPDRLWFRPSDAVAEGLAERTANRETPPWPSHMANNARRKRQDPRRRPGDAYDTHAVAVAIRRACERAGVAVWSPHRLRHSALTRIRKACGIEAAAAVAGHRTLTVTERYSMDAREALAVAAVARLG